MKIGIVGLGLIGTSVALAARRAWPDAEIIGVDRAEVVGAHPGPGTFNQLTTDPRQALHARVVILATPVDSIIQFIHDFGPQLREQSFVLDTGSTKRAILKAARDAGMSNFVGGHPMAGAESSGPGAARPNLFDDRPWFLIPARADSPAAKETKDFVETLGAIPVVTADDGSAHDRLMAAVSHLPQIVASGLMALVGDAVGESGLGAAGAGLRDTTRLGGSPAAVWASVLATNADEIRPLVLSLASMLTEFASRLEEPEATQALFDKARRWRSLL